MIRIILIYLFVLLNFAVHAQQDSSSNVYKNTADQLIQTNSRLNLGGYGEVHYNQPLNKDFKEAGTLDVHRMVLFFGYNFNSKTQFISEVEFEYAKELWVEQAFLQHRINKYINFRAGLLLIPMGIINEYHEPTTFHGVERPVIDNKISLSTWREIGTGLTGTILPVSLKYQAYLVSDLIGYDTKAVFSGAKGIREGRQKGSKSFFNQPAFAGKVEYFGLSNLNIGVSVYSGKSASRLKNKLHHDSLVLQQQADSSVIGITMIGVDARFLRKGFEAKAQFYYTNFNNTDAYNKFTAISGKLNDMPSANIGYYTEIAYNLLQPTSSKYELIPFVRYEWYNMHYKVEENMTSNKSLENTILTTGLTLKVHKNAAIKSDIQFLKSKSDDNWSKTLNLGIGVMF